MLLLAILLLLAAVGLLVAALVTGHLVLAWGSVGVSAVVVLALLVLARRSRRRGREAAEADPDAGVDDERDDPAHDDPAQDDAEQASPQPQVRSFAADTEVTVSEDAEAPAAREPAADSEPDEEDTDAADLLVVWELLDEVLVVDEHPRYHLTRCSWPDGAAAERLPVQEARELGFTPCAQCRPDAALARKRRAALSRQGSDADQEPDSGSRKAGDGTSSASSGGQDPDNSAVLG